MGKNSAVLVAVKRVTKVECRIYSRVIWRIYSEFDQR